MFPLAPSPLTRFVYMQRGLGRPLARYVAAVFTSSIGSWIHGVSNAWIVMDLGGGGLAVGVVTGAQFAPMLLIGLVAGRLADTFDRSRIFAAAQVTQASVTAALALAAAAGFVTIPAVVAAAGIAGVAIAFDGPARLSFVSDLVPEDRVASAVATNSVAFNSARIAGPAVAGLLISRDGTSSAFATAAVMYLLAAALMVGIRPLRQPIRAPRARIGDGLRYAFQPPRRSVLAVVALIGAFALNFSTVFPLLVRDHFHGSASRLGWLLAATGIGSLCGAVALARLRKSTHSGMQIGALSLAAGMTAVAVSPSITAAVALAPICGFGATVFLASANSTLQLSAKPEMRGRLMAVYLVIYMGTTPLGAPPLGWLSERVAPSAALVVGAVAAAAAGLAIRRPASAAPAAPRLPLSKPSASVPAPTSTAVRRRPQSTGDASLADLRVEMCPTCELASSAHEAARALFEATYADANPTYLAKSLATLDTIALAWSEDRLVGFSIGAQRTADLPRLPAQIVLLGGLTCIAAEWRRRGLSRELQRLSVNGQLAPFDKPVLAAGRMAHPATVRLARGAPGAVPAPGRHPTPWQREVGAAVARLYGTESFDADTFVCRGDGTAIGRPIVEVEADPAEWSVFKTVDRDRGDSLLVIWWGGSGPPAAW